MPIGYVTAPDGHRIPMYLLPEDVRLTRSALAAGIVTKEQVEASRAVYQSLMAATNGRAMCPGGGTRIISQGTCPWGGTAATLISEGWDADDDYYKDYEHTVGWTDDFVCMTPFYYVWTGGAGPAHEYHYDYQPGMTALSACIMAGGFVKFSAPNRAKIIRKKGDEVEVIKINLYKVQEGKIPDVELNPGDRVFIPESWL